MAFIFTPTIFCNIDFSFLTMRYYTNSGIFVITILFFFLPFLEIKCKNEPFAEMSGFDLALKQGMAFSNEETTDYMKDNEEFKALQKTQNKHDPFTIISILILLTAAICQLVIKRKRELMATIFSGVVALVMLAMQITFKVGWNKQMDEMGPMKNMFPLTLGFGTGYWLTFVTCILLFVLNIFFIIYDNKTLRQIESNYVPLESEQTAQDLNEEV